MAGGYWRRSRAGRVLTYVLVALIVVGALGFLGSALWDVGYGALVGLLLAGGFAWWSESRLR
jgi:hypothetical protein